MRIVYPVMSKLCVMTKLCVVLILAGLALPATSQDLPIGQALHPLDLPESAAEVTATPNPELKTATQDDDHHIFGLIPNYNAVNDPSYHYEPISTAEKFRIAAHDGFDPFSWVTTALYAGVGQWQNQYPQFGQGSKGYAKRYGGAFADGAISNFMSEAILPSLLHEDPRYFRLGKGSALHRIGYTISREWITRTDSGRERFNISEIVGNLGAAGLSNLYYPSQERSASETMMKFAVNIVGDAGFNVLKEFWPDWRHKFLHKPLPDSH
jgi:hypothetical protein